MRSSARGLTKPPDPQAWTLALLLTACAPGAAPRAVPAAPPPPVAASAPAPSASAWTRTPPEAEGPPAGTPPASGPWLDPAFDAWSTLKRRTVIAGSAKFRAEHDGPALPGQEPTALPSRVPVIEEADDAVRFLCEERAVRVAAFAKRDELLRVTLEGARLRPGDPDAKPDAGPAAGLYFSPGTQLAPTRADGDDWLLTLTTPGLRVRGRLPKAELGTVFEEREPALPKGTPALAKASPLYDAPNGHAFADLGAEQDPRKLQLVTRLGPSRDGFALVRATSPWGPLVGWIAASALSPPGEAFGELVGESIGDTFWSDAVIVTLARGTLLRAAADRPPIGVVLHDVDVRCAGPSHRGLTKPPDPDNCEGAPRVVISACEREVLLVADAASPPRGSDVGTFH